MAKNNLFNRKNKSQLIEQQLKEPFKRKTCSFYRYIRIADTQSMRDSLYKEWMGFNILGRVYLAKEGINAQISIPEFYWHEFIESLNKHKEFTLIHIKNALYEHNYSFIKPDPRHILHTLKLMGSTPERAIMVGDSHIDGEAGRKAGLPFILVSYGYKATKNEPLKADKVIDEFKMLPKVIAELSAHQ